MAKKTPSSKKAKVSKVKAAPKKAQPKKKKSAKDNADLLLKKHYAEACKKTGRDPKAFPEVSHLSKKDRRPIILHYMLMVVTESYNGDWKPNWNNSSEYKYYPWFWVKADAKRPSGFGFSGTRYDFTNSITNVGSRLCFKSSSDALDAAKKFEKLYLEYLLYLEG